MHRSLRMLGIIMHLQHGSSTLGALAERFECSTKSIQRDLDAMLSIGIPVVTTRGRNGGVSIDASWWMGPLNLTPEETEAIILAMENADFLPNRDEVLAKIRTAVRPAQFDTIIDDNLRPRVSHHGIGDSQNVQAEVRRIIARDLWCRIHYLGGANPGWRLVLPIELHISNHRWYMTAVDQRSQEFRTFRLDRIQGIEPTLGPSNAADIIEHAESKPEYGSTIYPEVIVDLTPAGITFCEDHPRLRDCLVAGKLQFRCPPSDYSYMARDLMRMGTDCRVIAPHAFIQEMRRMVLEMSEHLEI